MSTTKRRLKAEGEVGMGAGAQFALTEGVASWFRVLSSQCMSAFAFFCRG